MTDRVFEKALADFVAEGGGSVTLTPIVGDALIDPQFLQRVRRLRAEPRIDRIRLITNGILLDRFGIENVVTSGLDFLAVSTAGFDEETYLRVFRSASYRRMRDNLLSLLECNERLGRPLGRVSILVRSDRPYEEVVQSPDFKEALRYSPGVHYSATFSSFVGRIKPQSLPAGMYLFTGATTKEEPCQKLYDSPIVLPDGTVLACDCYSAMDAVSDLAIGNILERSLGEIWRGDRVVQLRREFFGGNLNTTCGGCDNYLDLSLYRGPEGRERARLSRLRGAGAWERRAPDSEGSWMEP